MKNFNVQVVDAKGHGHPVASAIKELCGDMSALQFCILQELAKELKSAGFPNIQDVQHRQGREFLTPDGLISVYSLGEAAPT